MSRWVAAVDSRGYPMNQLLDAKVAAGGWRRGPIKLDPNKSFSLGCWQWWLSPRILFFLSTIRTRKQLPQDMTRCLLRLVSFSNSSKTDIIYTRQQQKRSAAYSFRLVVHPAGTTTTPIMQTGWWLSRSHLVLIRLLDMHRIIISRPRLVFSIGNFFRIYPLALPSTTFFKK